MSVLIVSFPDDMHAYALIWAMAQRNVLCRLWSTENFPEQQRLTIKMSNSKDTQIGIASVEPLGYETIWLRHVTPPQSVSEKLAPADKPMALSEAKRCVDGTLAVMALDAVWINPPETRRLSNIKAYQLELAKRVGLVVPDTIISNDPDEIRAFAREHKGDIIYKSFAPATWRDSEKGTLWRLFTSALPPEVLKQDVAMTSCPGIYQARLAKSADIRIVFFGDTFYGARICSQATEEGKLDFRSDIRQQAPLEAFPISSTIYDQCNEFRKRLGLLHGSFDFVERPDGTLVFLEINEMGQFLWLEEKVPSLPLLDAFVSFSLEPITSFHHRPGPDRLSFNDFIKTEDYVRARELVENYWLSSKSTSMEFTYTE